MKSDIVIIGGGIVGISLAHELAKRGEDVTVLEKRFIGSGSTFRCGTGIRQQFNDEANVQVMKRSVELWKKYSEEYGFPFEQTGYLFLLYSEEEVKQFRENISIQNRFGVPTRLITPEEAKEIVPLLDTSEIIAASWNPTDGKADPFHATTAFALHAQEMSAKILEYTEAKDIIIVDNEIKAIKTNNGIIKTGIVINATNAWSKLINAMVKLPIRIPIEPYRHQAIITQPIKKNAINPMVISFKYKDSYLTQTDHGGVIGGIGYEVGPTYDLTPAYGFLREVTTYLSKIIPALRELLILRTWAGYYAKTPDSNPAIGKIEEISDYYIAAGFSGHGFMMGPAVGEMMADLITKGKTSLPVEWYDPYRFERGDLRQKALQMG
ncbi:MAG TPA: FAD-binding oxidoreductase [Thermococcaceae archaeon]|uniref:Sarcosine oxidase, beta subunit n=2 Tax=Thermococcus sibiricus TaxID=172049 RepID=C6A256_THESM|nr:FAD-binding oxidoreductase [Thermococcus sibiricus]ACS89701.1 Sarcosine oxidase, beta subunit [Thermococcus sibiricus MM 739]KUK17907.1 MAG: Sarcosine oxidase, beta subunit [Thermococcus sibiricus]KUK28814.1 MAG: Sarcosine oxidase, beta subunit [Thermococcus sp. 40_45]HII67578.1 FAD-binding oxidoreductase [Thermococcaceae archaeon]